MINAGFFRRHGKIYSGDLPVGSPSEEYICPENTGDELMFTVTCRMATPGKTMVFKSGHSHLRIPLYSTDMPNSESYLSLLQSPLV